ncbi:MAG: OmpA/MotB domain protein [bacterium]|nr:OmpA/MotB domain protein [bacterium]
MRAPTLVLVGLLLLPFAGVARADGFDGQRFVPAAGAAGWLVFERPLVPQQLCYGFGLFLNYGYGPVVDRDRPAGTTTFVLQHALTMDLLASIGLGNIFELAVGLPIDAAWIGNSDVFGGQRLSPGAGVGDIRLVPKMAWYFGRTNFNWGLGFMTPLYLPSGDENALRGAGGVQIDPTLLGALGGRRWNFTLNLGFRWRPNGKTVDFTGGKELHWGLAGTFGLVTGKVGLDLVVEWVGGYQPSALQSGTIAVPMEVDAALVIKPGREWSIYLGGAGGLDNGLAVPDGRFIFGVRYAHRVPGSDRYQDSDHDGIANGRDRCPDQAEDFDGFEDDDGCPEADNDHDGVLDDDDECPDQAGPRNNEGCPTHGVVVWRHGRLVIFGKVHFETGSARIQKRSDALVEQIAAMVKEHPEVGRIRIEGHTDNVGPPDVNLRLSRERAESVRERLIALGVPRARLETQGFGESHPTAPNRTRAGRAKNRRVEFVATR